MEQKFELVISSRENCTWQGTLRAGDETFPFQSELELLLALARVLPPEGLAELFPTAEAKDRNGSSPFQTPMK